MKSYFYVRVCRLVILAFVVSLLAGGVGFAEGQDKGKVNINKATVQVLAKLPGIGKKKAEAIVAYRNEKGTFGSTDDLQKVDGIGKKTLEKLKGRITVEGS